MNLKLTKPLAFIDIESTGLDKEADRIIELSIIIEYPQEETGIPLFKKTRRFNPGRPIPAASTEIHGITDEMVENEPSFKTIAESLHEMIKDCDIAGFGSNYFDAPMLFHEFRRSWILWDYSSVNFIDVGNIFKIQQPRTLSAAHKFYLGYDHTGAHSAEADASATRRIFISMLQTHDNMPGTVEEMAVFSNFGNKILDLSGKFAYNAAGVVIFNFGLKRGEPALDNESFLEWMLTKDFASDTQKICYELLQSLYSSSQNDLADYAADITED